MKKLKFALYPNKLTPDPNDFTARLLDVPDYTLDDIVRICTRPGTGMTEENFLSAFSCLEKTVRELSQSGTVTTSLFSTVFSLPGVFYDNEGAANKYEVSVSMTPDASLQEVVSKIKLERVRPVPVQPEIDYVINMETKERSETLAAGQLVQVKGKSLAINPEDTTEGMFLVDSTGKETVLPVFRNMPSELMLKVPKDLPAGPYRLEVRSRMKSKTLRTGVFNQTITVV